MSATGHGKQESVTLAALLAEWWDTGASEPDRAPSVWHFSLSKAVLSRAGEDVSLFKRPDDELSDRSGHRVWQALDRYEGALRAAAGLLERAAQRVHERFGARGEPAPAASRIRALVVARLIRLHLDPASPWPGPFAPERAELLDDDPVEELAHLVDDFLRRPEAMPWEDFCDKWAERWPIIWARGRPDRLRYPRVEHMFLTVRPPPPLLWRPRARKWGVRGTPRPDAGRQDWRQGLDRPVYDRYRGMFDGRLDKEELKAVASGGAGHPQPFRVRADPERWALETAASALGLSQEVHRRILVTVFWAMFGGHQAAPDEQWPHDTAAGSDSTTNLTVAELDALVRTCVERARRTSPRPSDHAFTILEAAVAMRWTWWTLHRWELRSETGITTSVLQKKLRHHLDPIRSNTQLVFEAPDGAEAAPAGPGAPVPEDAQEPLDGRVRVTALVLLSVNTSAARVLLLTTPFDELRTARHRDEREAAVKSYTVACEQYVVAEWFAPGLPLAPDELVIHRQDVRDAVQALGMDLGRGREL